MKKLVIGLTIIITALIVITLISMIVLCFLDKSIYLTWHVIVFSFLSFMEVLCIAGLISINYDEKQEKMKMLREAFFEKKLDWKIRPKDKRIADNKREIYKIFCNTLVDL